MLQSAAEGTLENFEPTETARVIYRPAALAVAAPQRDSVRASNGHGLVGGR